MQIARARLPPRPKPAIMPSSKEVHLPAPMGGLNTVTAGSEMPPSDCVALLNLIPRDIGLGARFGYTEWCINVGTVQPAEVRSILSFKGSSANGAADRTFACTIDGIWDVTNATNSPPQKIAFPIQTVLSGYGTAYNVVTGAGHFLLYTDQQNGYYLYSQAGDFWQKVVQSDGVVAWAAAQAVNVGDLRTNDGGKVYRCIVAGTTGNPGPTGTAQDITDGGGVHWAFNQSVSGVDPGTFANVAVWKARAWFTVRDSAQAWWLGLNSVGGAASQANFTQQFRLGGHLLGLWNWAVDGGNGLDNYLVAISGGGDVAIYRGTDPTSAATFGLVAVWGIGGLPSGRRVVTEFGGDILIVSTDGVVALTKIVQGNVVFDRSQYSTAKVSNLLNKYISLYGSNPGWALKKHPEDNSVLVIVPVGGGQPSTQLAFSVARKSWSQYAGLPMLSAEQVGGKLFFGTIDGRVCINTGFLDQLSLVGNISAPGVPVDWSLLTSFQNIGSPRKKMVDLIRPIFRSQQPNVNYQALARYDFDTTPQLAPDAGPTGGASVWDSALWDQAVWGAEFTASENISGATGIGAHVAIAIRGQSISDTQLIGFDITYREGGFL